MKIAGKILSKLETYLAVRGYLISSNEGVPKWAFTFSTSTKEYICLCLPPNRILSQGQMTRRSGYLLLQKGLLINFSGCLGFLAYQPLLFIYCQIHFYTNNQFYSKQFSLAWVHSLIVKIFLFQAIQFNQTVLVQTIQFSISIDFVYTQIIVKTVLY